ncbi:MAG: hypothetical protein AAFR61_21395 [Bacteroidota bacterium]
MQLSSISFRHLLFSLLLLVGFSLVGFHPHFNGLAEISQPDETVIAKRGQILAGAIKKLNAQEKAALLALMSDVSQSSSRKLPPKGRIFFDKQTREFLRFFPVAKFMAADGTTFDTYAEYVAYQWGSGSNSNDPWGQLLGGSRR